MIEPEVDLGKVRVYKCVCGARSIRPLLNDKPNPCPNCGTELAGRDYQVDDHKRFIEQLLHEARDND